MVARPSCRDVPHSGAVVLVEARIKAPGIYPPEERPVDRRTLMRRKRHGPQQILFS